MGIVYKQNTYIKSDLDFGLKKNNEQFWCRLLITQQQEKNCFLLCVLLYTI
jgi:hypothetical protein